MNNRAKDLLQYLSNSSTPKRGRDIVDNLGISLRSIKNYVDEINEFYSKPIILSSRNGYELNRAIEINMAADEYSSKIPQSFEERSAYIIQNVIAHRDCPLNIYELCDNLYISYSTVKSTISKMNKKFSAFHIKFCIKQDNIYLSGEETDKQKMITYLINESSENSYADFTQLQSLFPNYDIKHLRSFIFDIFHKHNYYLNDFNVVNYILHLLFIINRTNRHNVKQLQPVAYDARQTKPSMLDDLIATLEAQYNISFNSDERNEISLLTNSLVMYSIQNDDAIEKFAGIETFQFAKNVISSIKQLYLINLQNSTFFIPFVLHLNGLIYRAEHDIVASNPFTHSIKQNNPIVFDLAAFVGLEIQKEYHMAINEDELAFLAMHIGGEIERQGMINSRLNCILICPSYLHINTFLSNHLMMMFGTLINITKNIDSKEKNYCDLSSYDIIFTLDSLTGNANNIIKLDPYNLKKDQAVIGYKINTIITNKKKKLIKEKFNTLFTKDIFINTDTILNRNDILHCLCDKLVFNGYVEEDFFEQVMQREMTASTAFGLTAIPHSMEMNAINSCISVAISKKGFHWENNIVHIVLLLVINKIDSSFFHYLYESVIELFSDPVFFQQILSATTFEEFIQLLLPKLNI